ncbi:MAG: Riboflavin synthase, partial [Alphaproteobacteria bacterium MarineAlpha3_Bin6]
ECTDDVFKVDVVPETIRRTNLGLLKVGDSVNLERSTRLGARVGGHLVQGHVDCTSEIRKIAYDGVARLIEFKVPSNLMKYVVEKGFVCVDGVSLTVVKCGNSSFAITLIPYTSANTILGSKSVGDFVNLEMDMIAKYIERLSRDYKKE